MSCIQRHRRALLCVAFVSLLGGWLTENQKAIAEHGRNKEQKKRSAEAAQLIRRLAKAKVQSQEDATRRLAELDAAGEPVRRLLCETLLVQKPKDAEKTLLVLERLSAPAATFARAVMTAESASAGMPKVVFEKYTNAFNDLSAEREVDHAVSPLIVASLTRLARIGNVTQHAAAPSEIRWKAYRAGTALLARCARSDDAAFGDLLSLTANSVSYPGKDEWSLHTNALDALGIAIGNDARRIKAAMPVLTRLLEVAMAPPINPRASIGESALAKGLYDLMALSVIRLCERIGPKAADIAPRLRSLQSHPTLGKAATEALEKIGG